MTQALIQELISKAGLTPEQAAKAATVAQDFMKAQAGNADWAGKAKDMAHDAGEKFSDFAAKAKVKAEEFADKAEDFAEDAMDKLKDLFGSKKEDVAPTKNNDGSQPQDIPVK